MFEKILQYFGLVKKDKAMNAVRSVFQAAGSGNLYSSWTTSSYSANAEIYSDLDKLRARSRQLGRDNDYVKRFFAMMQRNIIGQQGNPLQMRVMSGEEADQFANNKIEEAWTTWQRKENCDISKYMSFFDMQNVAIRSVARDGEVFIRKVRSADNPFQFSLQFIESDHLDHRYNEKLSNGNQVKMGIELDNYGRPVAYHMYKQHPGDTYFATMRYGEKERIPADDIIHLFIRDRISQNRGLPWLHAAMTRLNMLGGYEEAELVAARIGASDMGFFEETDESISTSSASFADDTDADTGDLIFEATPGSFRRLPKGLRFNQWKPEHPTTAFEAFEKAILRGIASGADVGYNQLANDFEGVNYSSLRASEIEIRDAYRIIQRWFKEHFLIPVFEEWLTFALLTKMVDLPFSKYNKFNKPSFQQRGFMWVDPKNEMMSNALALSMGIKAPSMLAAEQGNDYEDVLKMIKRDADLRKKYNIEIMDDAKLAQIMADASASDQPQ